VPSTSTCNLTEVALASAASCSARVVMAWAKSLLSTVEARKRLHGLPSLGDDLRRLINRAPKDLLGVGRARIEHRVSRLEAEQQTLNTLQQPVVQITSDAGAFSYALLQAYVEYARVLTQPKLIQPCSRCQKEDHAQRTFTLPQCEGEAPVICACRETSGSSLC